MTIVERFLKYVSFDTQSAEDTGVTPSTAKQFALAEYLNDESVIILLSRTDGRADDSADETILFQLSGF